MILSAKAKLATIRAARSNLGTLPTGHAPPLRLEYPLGERWAAILSDRPGLVLPPTYANLSTN